MTATLTLIPHLRFISIANVNGFESWSSQSNDLKFYTCHYLALYAALLGYGKEQLNEEARIIHD